MGTTLDFANYCCELLASLGPCRARRMFGGYGISVEGLTVAILADLGGGERLYLKADEATRARFEAAQGLRFTYQAKGKTMGLNYYTVPEEAMESPQPMQPWALLALEAAVRARKPATRRTTGRAKKPAPKASP